MPDVGGNPDSDMCANRHIEETLVVQGIGAGKLFVEQQEDPVAGSAALKDLAGAAPARGMKSDDLVGVRQFSLPQFNQSPGCAL